MNHVQQARPRWPQRLRLHCAAEDGIALAEGAQRHQSVEQHLGGARICAQSLRDLRGEGAFPDGGKYVQLQGGEQYATFLKSPGRLDQIG